MIDQASNGPAAEEQSGGGQPMIRVAGLCYDFPGRRVLNDVNFSVAGGEIFGLLGPNGSGKSTLLRILTGLRQPAAGHVEIAGHDVAKHPAAVRHCLGVAFQTPSLDKKLSVEENLRFQGYLFSMRGKALAQRVQTLLERFGLLERRRERAETLSGGLKRRVELAKALLHEPAVLLLDEPSTGLDPAARQEFWSVLTDMGRQEQLTVIVATHMMDEAERCGRVALLDQGRLVALDSPKSLKERVSAETVTIESGRPAELAEQIRAKLGLQAMAEGESVRVQGKDGWEVARKVMAAFQNDVQSVRVGKPTLEDVFLALTGRSLAEGEVTP